MFSEEPWSFRARIYAAVRMIPSGKVATYGQIATLAGQARAFRACGTLMGQVVDNTIPWHRVINAQGRVSTGNDVARPMIQRQLLEAEGIHFRRSGTCDLKLYRWEGPQEALPWEE